VNNQVVVIAFGGNALGYNYEEQRKAVEGTALVISDLIEEGFKVVLTHGNGPQVGMIQTAMDELSQMYPIYTQVPLPSCVAMSQGYIAFELQRAIKVELNKRNIEKNIVSILTQVSVDDNDPAFKNPTKPIGCFMSKEKARSMEKQGLKCMEDAGRGYRLTVASPKPKKIIELSVIRRLIDEGDLVIACGGGGIPVAEKPGSLEGISAVIDKDSVSALLAKEIGADFLVILTAVEKIAINFGKKNQKWLASMSLVEADMYIKQEQFAPGSMLPKVEAAMEFVSSGINRKALITLLRKAREGLLGETGTVIHK
jgi:carbamate kinase